MMNAQWECKAFNELDIHTLYDILKLREEVFILEQECLYNDIDDIDLSSHHVWVYQGKQMIAYARIIPGTRNEYVKLGRIIVHRLARGKGLGKELVQQSIDIAKQLYTPLRIEIAAQQYLQLFYESFGFICKADPYDLDGIPHIDMTLHLR